MEAVVDPDLLSYDPFLFCFGDTTDNFVKLSNIYRVKKVYIEDHS